MVMDSYCFHDQKPELWAKINSLHLNYLEMEESPQKLEHKNKLDDCIKKYLYIAPHNQKFFFKETAEVLHRSASSKKDFSGYRAALGWNAIGMYAGNLISQPWRQEYREIKMYSGFYKHQIQANLVGAEIMFEAMGYKHAGNGILVLEGPVCPDTVKYVSQDSLVAYVECQILKEIWEEVTASFKISWLDVLQFRETHLCSPKKSIEALKYQIQQRQFQDQQRSYSQTNNDYITSNSRYSTQPHQHITSPNIQSNHSFPPLTTHAHLPMSVPPTLVSPTQCTHSNGYYSNNYTTYGVVPPVYNFANPSVYGHIAKQPYNGYYCNGHIPQTCVMPVPTAQLIEIEPPPRANYDLTDNIRGSRYKNPQSPKIYDKDEVTGTFESWDYVYRNLESQGYSKDLGERGDVLSVNRRDSKQAEHEQKIGCRPMKINEALEKMKIHDRTKKIDNTERKPSPDTLSSSYDNLSTQELVRRVNTNVKSKANTVGMKLEDAEPQMRRASKTLDLGKSKANQIKSKQLEVKQVPKYVEASNDKESVKIEDSDKWQCATCTYLNDRSKKICDICSKSRIVVNQDMEIGGSECSKCTLVNPKSNTVCEACNTTLQNSPTYI
ncbi:spermatogenesis-associated protein 2/tamozhennic [Holotrichia oblita]|uniref:Spermatogenesis-associated protein 2/tamozhennic n=1 Tax=Holotrichia oblita TaxID=644536 RepID=A0ACB9TNC6_HOLOL|nr:spermatogenesis-associated protein 2/tamozhennic [Holotrichia oblita]